jgi:hypothetical protein
MKKIMLIIVIILLLTVGIFASNEQIQSVDLKTEMVKFEKKSEKINDDFFNDPMFLLLKTKYSNKEIREKAIDQYSSVKFFGNIPEEEAKYIYNSVNDGADYFEISEIYNFWKTTVEPIEMIATIYSQKPEEPKKFWVEDVYNELTNYKNGVLDRKKLDSYLENGITDKEIAYANSLSRKNVYTIEEILNRRKEKKQWLDIVDDVNKKTNKKYQKNIKRNMFKTSNKPIEVVITAMSLSEQTGTPVSDYLEQNVNQEDLIYYKQQADSKMLNFIEQKLIEKGYIEPKEKEVDEKYKESFIELIKSKGLNEEKISELSKKGYEYIDIYNAQLVALNKQMDIDLVLGKKTSDIEWSAID